MRHAPVLAGILLIVAGCGAGPGPASTGSSEPMGSPGPSAVPASPTPADPSPADPSPDAPKDPPPGDEPPAPDPASFLQVCWGLESRDEAPVPCADAVATALIGAGLDVPAVTRVDARFDCDDTPCPPPSPDVVHVTVLTGDRAARVEVIRGDDGALTVAAVRPGSSPAVPPFEAPPPARATLPDDAPPGLAAREPYPLCGEEATPMGGPYDEAARTCFLTGVLAGSPVEFASVGSGTEGQPFVMLYRFDGAGGIEHVFGEAGTWVRTFTGIGEAGGGLVFDIEGMATAREPVP